MKYFDALCEAMAMLGRDPRTVFVGQAVRYEGTAMYGTLRDVPLDKRIELPVAEDFQMGASIGMALSGHIVISLFPRWNFLLLACNQLVNHLDKLEAMSGGGYVPHVIVRTAVGSVKPLDPQHQHRGDYARAFDMLCDRVEFINLQSTHDILPSYKYALERGPIVIVEYADLYNE